MKIELTPLAACHFDPETKGTVITTHSVASFEEAINTYDVIKEQEGQFTFSRLFFFENFTDAKLGCVPVKGSGEIHFKMRSGYVARAEGELPVLTRWIEVGAAPAARVICVVCYDKEQLKKEGDYIQAEWGVVAILGLMTHKEEPMLPATMLRNALGISEGGNGEPLDHKKFLEAVKFWQNHITVKVI